MVSPITCHILDTTVGKPASNVRCELSVVNQLTAAVESLGVSQTDADGRVKTWSEEVELVPGVYQIRFFTKEYFEKEGRVTFFPFVDITFEIPKKVDNHYHIPLLLSNYGYSTYRGS